MGPCSSKDQDVKKDQAPLLNNQMTTFQPQMNQSVNLGQQNQFNNDFNQKGKNAPDTLIQNLVHERKGLITQYYQILSPALGKGSYGEVRKAINKQSGMLRAIKIIHKRSTGSDDIERLMNEVEILKKLVRKLEQFDHPNIIRVYEYFQDQNFFYIVTELCTGPELFEKIQEVNYFNEKDAANIMSQILEAVNYCHGNNIVHRDLKPENLLYDTNSPNGILKVIDFGTSRTWDQKSKLTQRIGTPYYMAPEIMKQNYNFKCDIWSCGVIMYILLCGYPPFRGKSDEQIFQKVTKGVYTFDEDDWRGVSNEAKLLIKHMLEIDIGKRYTAEQCLNDQWIKRYAKQSQVDAPILTKTLNNMKEFQTSQKLQDAIYQYIINFLTTKDEKKELLQTFKQLDLNGDGKLSRAELLQGYLSIMNQAQAEEEVNRIMRMVDKDKNGTIDYTGIYLNITFQRICYGNNKQKISPFQIKTRDNIQRLDLDGSGFVTAEELSETFGRDKNNHEFLQKMIDEVDLNNDGKISLEEFKNLMIKLSEV